MVGRRPVATLITAVVVGVAGCAPAAPSPRPFASSGASALSTPVEAAIASATPAATPPSELMSALDVRSLDPVTTDSILEFASDGRSVLFSAGLAEDAADDAAPDLWRIHADEEDPEPELVWRNPERDHSIVRLAGDLGSAIFVDIPLDGSRAWDLWLIPQGAEEAILLDSHPGDEAVSSLVPSFSIQESTVAWTAFDVGATGPVSQLLVAQGPDWRPTVLQERPAAEAELWLPSFHAGRLAYSEIRYSVDRTTDTRGVYLLDRGSPDETPRRLDRSDRATMPLLVGDTVLWKEADRGFSMFNWGTLWRSDSDGGNIGRLDTTPQDYVNYPSAGARFIAWWGANAFEFGVYDLVEQRPRLIERYAAGSQTNVLRPHIAGDLLAWLHVEGEGPDSRAQLRYAFMPPVRSPR
jgi:hypothetical protein